MGDIEVSLGFYISEAMYFVFFDHCSEGSNMAGTKILADRCVNDLHSKQCIGSLDLKEISM